MTETRIPCTSPFYGALSFPFQVLDLQGLPGFGSVAGKGGLKVLSAVTSTRRTFYW